MYSVQKKREISHSNSLFVKKVKLDKHQLIRLLPGREGPVVPIALSHVVVCCHEQVGIFILVLRSEVKLEEREMLTRLRVFHRYRNQSVNSIVFTVRLFFCVVVSSFR